MDQMTLTATTFARDPSSRPAAQVHKQAVHQMLAPFPVAYFMGAFVTDLVYWRMPDVMWERFSVWLITAGLVMAALVAITALIDLAFRGHRPVWVRALGYLLAVLLSILNVFVHSRDGYTAVVPTGLALSAVVFVILLLTSSMGWALTSRPRAGAGK
jgi:uncharacterized membrane protein